jgi:hypothetical protein
MQTLAHRDSEPANRNVIRNILPETHQGKGSPIAWPKPVLFFSDTSRQATNEIDGAGDGSRTGDVQPGDAHISLLSRFDRLHLKMVGTNRQRSHRFDLPVDPSQRLEMF